MKLILLFAFAAGCSSSKDSSDPTDTGQGGGAPPATEDTAPQSDSGSDEETDTDSPEPVDTGEKEPEPEDCVWPSGPVGVDLGQSPSKTMSWMGYAPQESAPRRIHLEEFYDCDGRLGGMDALLLIVSQFGCPSCDSEAEVLDQNVLAWTNQGHNVQVITLLLDNPDNSMPATIDSVADWRSYFPTQRSHTVTDPSFSMVLPNQQSIGTPMEVIVDPQSMTVVHRQEGWDSQYTALKQFLATK